MQQKVSLVFNNISLKSAISSKAHCKLEPLLQNIDFQSN